MLDAMHVALQRGQHAVFVGSYELGAAMHGIAPRDGQGKLATILLFADCQCMTREQVDTWLAHHADEQPAGVAAVQSDTDRAAFDDAMARIHAYIEAGDTYQVNYTYRLHFDAFGSLQALYARLRERQPVPYGALISLPDGSAILSLSPELFVRHDASVLTAQPMKGTAPASGVDAADASTAQALSTDAKSRAENLMIVDLLRNDLGRIAEVGSVGVERLFDVQRYASVLQMTSTVYGRLCAEATLQDVFAALYPCGSITGAPKRRTMQIIRELEGSARGVYTGAIGWFDPVQQGEAIGSFCLSVPIRTLQLDAIQHGLRKGCMGIGAGIVHDSVAADEYAECLLKARFLTGLACDFQLFETMRASDDQVPLLERHLQRLRRSAHYFGFRYDEAHVRSEVAALCANLAADTAHRVRLALAHDGTVQITSAPLVPLDVPVTLLLADAPVDADDVFLRHKTTVRTCYDQAWREAEQQGAFDKLFFNQHGALTEGGRSSVFVRIQGAWFTPPLSAGLLPGVMRDVLLQDAAWQARERSLTREDLQHAEEIVVCNALRGVLPARLSEPD